MKQLKKIIMSLVICVLTISLSACGKQIKNNASEEIYGKTVGRLEDDELFAIIDTNASLPVLLVTSRVYDDGLGNRAALTCDIYYPIDGKVQKTGSIQSFGTAYPISYDESGIYAASGHGVQRFGVQDADGSVKLEEDISEIFDEEGNSVYMRNTGNHTEAVTEEEYLSAVEKYGRAAIVDFGYGASGNSDR